MSLHAWAILTDAVEAERFHAANAILEDDKQQQDEITMTMAMHRYRQEIVNPPCELSVYTDPLNRLNDEWCLVHLCIDNVVRFEAHELLSLARLSPLNVLELIEREPSSNGISDRIIRGWSEVKWPFRGLKVLKITSRTHAVSETSLEYVFKFPALQIFDVTTLPVSRWRNARTIAAAQGWKVSQPKDSLFVSYADAYLDGRHEVHMTSVEGLRRRFEDDRQEVSLAFDPRSLIPQAEEEEGELQVLHEYLDDGWRAILQGVHPLSAEVVDQGSENRRQQEAMSDNDAFWFLALLDQRYKSMEVPVQAQVDGVTVAQERVVHLRLYNPSNLADRHRRTLHSERLIFSRASHDVDKSEKDTGNGDRPPRSREGGEPPRGRGETDLKPRKRQKLADVLSSLGV